MPTARETLEHLNRTYVGLHTPKEDAFWSAYMGLCPDPKAAREDLDKKEIALKRFLSDPAQLTTVREALAQLPADAEDELAVALRGWERTFQAHTIDSEEARALAERIVDQEGALAQARGSMNLGYEHPSKGFQKANSVTLATLLANDPDEQVRKAAWEGMRAIEPHVLEHGFLEVLKARNALGRSLGYADYYDYKVQNAEGMSKDEVFALLDELEELTREAGERAIRELKETVGAERVTPWNVRYLTQGDVTKAQDPYLSFQASLGRWGRSFAAMGIRYRGAHMRLDLVNREGKYENGFMHGPEVSWREQGELHRARIQFTANAIPGMVGSGARATRTLFHEGGHAAHFANIDMPAPCFGQEFAPTSVAFAETQSMFLDSLLGDADWQERYAKTADGSPIPWSLIEEGIRARQPMAAWGVRAMLAVCYGEKALYELPEAELTPARVLEVLRETERRMLFLDEGSPRPVLAVPHLLAGESSAYYHGYVLAEMGVHQTRAFFTERDGHLMDNPKIGPDLAETYWRPGNSLGCSAMIERLTGKPLGAAALAAHVNRSVDEALEHARAMAERGRAVPPAEGPVDLDAHIAVVHGHEEVASLAPGGDFDAFAAAFAEWIDRLATAS